RDVKTEVEGISNSKATKEEIPWQMQSKDRLANQRMRADFLICNPALPKMAQAICVYALIVAPALWLVGLLSFLGGPEVARLSNIPDFSKLTQVRALQWHADFVNSQFETGCHLAGLGLTIFGVFAGLKLRALKRSAFALMQC